ncbi:MAG: protein kinase domain-containing protein [Candidatus Omnitrophota bacterium]
MKIADYTIREKLFSAKKFSVYRTINEKDDKPYILKISDQKAGRDLDISNALRQEYHYLRLIDSEYVIKAIDWIEDQEYTAMVLEDIDGKSLKEYIRENRTPFDPETFIPLAIGIARGLAAIHSQNFIHKDINPTNIVWNSRTGDLKIIDFNIACKCDIDISPNGSSEKLQGTFPYISPEQTGRMNRPIDHRTDLYSLGVAFYELLTGKLPFDNDNSMEIVYAHLAQAPDPPHTVNEKVPSVLSRIILKLMAKNPEERYQSAVGLIRDLERAIQCDFNDFPLGENDFPGKLHAPEKLHGRDKEIEQLRNAYHETCAGKKRLIFVTGGSGAGKTSLVNALHQSVVQTRGVFISGTFDRIEYSKPYVAFARAINQFCQYLLTEPEEILAQWRTRLLQSVGQFGKRLTDLIPQLEAVIGKQPEGPEMGNEETKTYFNDGFQCFLRDMGSQEHPLVIFIDDMQWADPDSLELLHVLAEDRQSRYVLFIGAYRDNDMSPDHPLIKTIEDIRRHLKLDVRHIPLPCLSLEHTRELLTDILHTGHHTASKDLTILTDLVYKKTSGNAFFTIRFLENLFKKNLLTFDFNQARWQWDIDKIESQDITDNEVGNLLHKYCLLWAEKNRVTGDKSEVAPSTVSLPSTESTGEFLDGKSIIKASQTLSGEVSLGHLLEKMMHILIENAGAKKAVFIENFGEQLLIQAESAGDGVTGILQRQPFEESGKVPRSVIHYVARSGQVLVLENATKDDVYAQDPYVQTHRPRSLLCFPIIRKEQLVGIIYLENNLVEGVFTPSRVEILNILSAQIAISMENAKIYHDLRELNERLEQKVRERTRQLEEMDKAKSRFFANISHEFRTPLTLIMGPLEQLLTEPREQDAELHKKLSLMLRNSQRLLGLINQLLELSRFDSGKITLHAARQNIIPFLKGILYTFETLGTQNKLELKFEAAEENIELYFDREKLEEAVFNLVSNAVKFTPAGGQITLAVRKEEDVLVISVRDTGPGIPPECLGYIFDRFYQVDNTYEHHRKGSGIGLAIVKEIIGLHRGTTRVTSPGQGKGTVFELRLPFGRSHLADEDIVEPDPGKGVDVSAPIDSSVMIEGYAENETGGGETENHPKEHDHRPIVLVIEDNADVRAYIRSAIEPLYMVIGAKDGEDGVAKARDSIPDLVICDIMMPGMDGYEVCRVLKNDLHTSHIPIILLTAKAQDENIIQGLETGADDYITKPFNTRMLNARIKNLIDLRLGLQEKIKNQMVLQPTKMELGGIDIEFMKELQKAIETHLDDFDFNVEELGRLLYMSHATLYRKVMALTGESPTEFIRSYRLKRAAERLKMKRSKPLTIKDIAFGVGFSSTAYFTHCFKEKFHRLPSSYLNESDS